MKAYSFSVRYEYEQLYHTGNALETDIDSLPEAAIESIKTGSLVRIDNPEGMCISYYHIDQDQVECIFLGFWLANNYKYAFNQMKEQYNKTNSL